MKITDHNHTNNTDSYQVVANYEIVIAECETSDLAEIEMNRLVPVICDSPYAIVQVVAPGETVSGQLQSPFSLPEPDVSDWLN